MKLRDFPTFPRFTGKWTDTSVTTLDRFMMTLRDYLTKQPQSTLVTVEWTGPSAPSKALASQSKPIGVVPISFEKQADGGFVSESVAAPIQWVWSVVDGRPTLTFPTLAALVGTYRMVVDVREAS